ncbi:amnion associated transmembrane protein [Brevipalpus obovatus]|uniref:amnion associated transmembrane protein n=1 Tax=Brevipalpus obovatus TaxID=246614 RepID=UPI003D9F4DF8
MFRLTFILFGIFQILSSSATLTKVWNVNYNKHESNSWIWDKVYCPRDKIIIPDDSVIFLNQSIVGRQIVMPHNGEIILGEEASIGGKANRNRKGRCQGTAKQFFLEGREWLDPKNWNVSLHEIGLKGGWTNNPMPHTDRIPCPDDHIIFPTEASFKVMVNLPQSVHVNSITIGGAILDEENFKRFLASKTGRSLFKINPLTNGVVVSSKESCGQSICPCSLPRKGFREKVCSFVECPNLEDFCDSPLQLDGFCCPICGVALRIASNKDRNFIDFNQIFEDFWMQKEYDGSVGYAYVDDEGNIIGVIVNIHNDGSKSLENARKILEVFSTDELFRSVEIELLDSESEGFFSRTILWLIIILAILGTLYAFIHIQEYHLHIPGLGLWFGDRRQPTTSPQFTFMRFNGLEEMERTVMELDATNRGDPSEGMMRQIEIGREPSTISLKVQDKHSYSIHGEQNQAMNSGEEHVTNFFINSVDENELDTISLDPLVDKN